MKTTIETTALTNKGISIDKEFVQKETEKAVCIRVFGDSVRYGYRECGDRVGRDMWIPKSIIKDSIVPMWFIIKFGKENNLKDVEFPGIKVGVGNFH